MQKKSIHQDEYKNIIDRLVEARESIGLTQKEVSDLIGKSQSYVSKIENSQLRIDIIQLTNLAKLYKKEITFFFDR